MRDDAIFSVYQLNEYVRRMLAGDPALRSIQLRGEISGFKKHISGHCYFALKDEQARVQCVLFRQNALSLDFEPKDGMRVVVSGAVSLFVRDGAYQVYCESVRKEGLGELYLRFLELKRRLDEEGLFDPALKKPLPAFPGAIGVVTSLTGAVLHDIVRVARRRNPRVNILVCPAAVQGEGSARAIADALALLNADGRADVILCGRGGGSMEDLWPFNEEIVARAIAASRIPVVSCVGHETDFTIADFVADLRAPTPSAAAELVTPVLSDLAGGLDEAAARLYRALRSRADLLAARLERLAAAPALSAPEGRIIEPRAWAVAGLTAKLDAAARASLDGRRNALALLERALGGLNPGAVLSRGYSVVRSEGKLIASAGELRAGQPIEITMRNGSVDAEVINVNT